MRGPLLGATLALIAVPAFAQDSRDVLALSALAQADLPRLQAQIAQVYPQVELALTKTADDLPPDLADPEYLHVNGFAFATDAQGALTSTGVTCTRLGRASVARLDAAQPGALNETLPHFRFVADPLAPGARAMLTCLFQHNTYQPDLPFVREDVLDAMAAYPGATRQRVLPTPDPTGVSRWYEHRDDTAEPRGAVVSPLMFNQGILGQDLSFVVQIYD